MVEPGQIAASIDREIRSLPAQNTAGIRAVRRRFTRELKEASPDCVLGVARKLHEKIGSRWIAYELIRSHSAAFRYVDARLLEELGGGMNSWWEVDQFARILAGPAWLNGQVADQRIATWARSKDIWWRRAALVSTVALNLPPDRGKGDAQRTLAVCRLLATDHEDMVAKALSWALRALSARDPAAVQAFLEKYGDVLAARVKREVCSKLATGLKNPGRHSKRKRRVRT